MKDSKKRIRIAGGGNLLNIAFAFFLFLFINVALNIYFGYISSPETKTLFLQFCILVLIGFISFAAFLYFKRHNLKYISLPFKRIIIVLLVLLTFISYGYAFLLTTLVLPQIQDFFNYCIVQITSFKFSSSLFFILFVTRLDSLLSYASNNTFINLVALISIALFVLISLKICFHLSIPLTTYQENNISENDNNYRSLRIEDTHSKRFKRRLSFGYIYKVVP